MSTLTSFDEVTVTRTRRLPLLLAFLVLAGLAVWGAHHVISLSDLGTGRESQLAVVFAIAFLMLVGQTALYYLERPHTVTTEQHRELAALHVVVPVPVYNEAPDLLWRCLSSLLGQERLPNHVFVVDDGSTDADYAEVRAAFVRLAQGTGVKVSWLRTRNRGKRHAQGEVARRTPEADVYLTVDSDAYLPRNAVTELLKPFADAGVQSVAGVVLASNSRRNFLTRFTDLWFVTGQLVDRSAQSTMGSVLVNSGPLAAYRGGVVRDFLDTYLNETFFGRKVEFSDDSMLTIFALSRGKAVQQPTAYALTSMPETFNHHLRQYLRWMRGAFIRSWWRFKYLRVSGYAFWSHLMGWVQMAISTVLFGYLFIVQPVILREFSPWLLLVPLLIGYAQALRYLSFRRSDETIWSQLATLALSPVSTLWMFFVLRPVRWYAMATCLKTGWGTRQKVEIGSAPAIASA